MDKSKKYLPPKLSRTTYGTIGKLFTYWCRQGVQWVRKYPHGLPPPVGYDTPETNLLTRLAAAWSLLTQEQRDSWKRLAKPMRATPWHAFAHRNSKHLIDGTPIETVPI